MQFPPQVAEYVDVVQHGFRECELRIGRTWVVIGSLTVKRKCAVFNASVSITVAARSVQKAASQERGAL